MNMKWYILPFLLIFDFFVYGNSFIHGLDTINVGIRSNSMERVNENSKVEDGEEFFDVRTTRLASTKKLGDNYVVESFNYKKDEKKTHTGIVIAGKANLENSFGKTQNGAVTMETAQAVKGLEEPGRIDRLFNNGSAKFYNGIAETRMAIYNIMKHKNLMDFTTKESTNDDIKKIKAVSDYVKDFYACAAEETFSYEKAGFVVAQIWDSKYYPNQNSANYAQFYVVPPKKSEIINTANIWLNLLKQTGENIVRCAYKIIETEQLPQLAIQLHLPGAGKFLYKGVSEQLANHVFSLGIRDGIKSIKNQQDRAKLELDFAFTPYIK